MPITIYINIPTRPIIANAIHVDTVKLSHVYHLSDLPPPDELKRRNFDLTFKEINSNEILIARSKSLRLNPYEPRLTVTESQFGYCGITVEVSFAKLIDNNGLGVHTDEDFECGLDAIEDYIYQRLGIRFNARTAKVQRLDVNADFPVGERRICSYIKSLSSPSSTLTRGEFGSTTATFFNGSRTFIVYGKKAQMEKECRKGRTTYNDVEKSEGILRVESRLKTLQAVNRFAEKLSLPYEAGQLISLPVASYLISDTLSLLHLDKPIIGKEGRNTLLVEVFGKRSAQMLGFLEFRKYYGEDFWKVLGFSKQTYHKKKKELVDANLWNISPNVALPALIIPNAYNNPTSLS